MSELWKANVRKEWIVHRSLLLDYLVCAVVAVTVLPFDRALGFGVVASVLAASLGARIGGDEAMWGSREFVFTRPIRRRDWVRLRFGIGLLPLAAMLALFLVADAAEVHQRFAALVAEPLEPGIVPSFRPVYYLPFVTGTLLVYALAFGFAAREARPEQVLNHRGGAWILGGALSVLTWLFAAAVLRGALGWFDMPNEPNLDTPAISATVAGLTLLLSGAAYLWARRGVERLEIAGDGLAEGVAVRPGRGGALMVGVVLVVLILAVAAMILVPMRVSESQPTFQPSTASPK